MTIITPINIGSSPNDGTGDTLREGLNKTNANIDNLNNDKLEVADIAGKQDILAEGPFVDGDKTKLDGIEAGAEVNIGEEYTADDKTKVGYIPVIQAGDAGKKLTVNVTENGYEYTESTTTPGFNDVDNITIDFVEGTRTLSLTPAIGTIDFTLKDGSSFNKVSDSIVITDQEGLHLVYYDTSGNLQVLYSPNRSEQRDILLANLPVSFILWDATNKLKVFVTDVLKEREMSVASWVKNFYDKPIYVLNGMVQNNDPSVGGTVTPSGTLETDAQFGISAGQTLFTDRKFDNTLKSVGDNWKVNYLEVGNIRQINKTAFSVLTDVDLGVGVTGRLLYNNGGTPVVVANNNYVWYMVGISNDINGTRLSSFMGQSEYGSLSGAENALESEIATVENSFGLRQEFTNIYAVLFQTGNTYSNSVKARIRNFFAITDSSGTSATTQIPDELIDGSDASSLHNHDSLYVDLTTAQTIAGVKTFSSSPVVPTPTTDFQTATKKYVDDNAGGGGAVSVLNTFTQAGTIVSGTYGTWTSGQAGTINEVNASYLIAPTGTSATVEVFKNDVSIGTVTITAGEGSQTTFSDTTLAKYDKISYTVTEGGTIAGGGISVNFLVS